MSTKITCDVCKVESSQNKFYGEESKEVTYGGYTFRVERIEVNHLDGSSSGPYYTGRTTSFDICGDCRNKINTEGRRFINLDTDRDD